MKKITVIFLAMSSLCFADKPAIPENIYNQIVQKAEQEWPGDYRMQEYIILEQMNSYLEIQKVKKAREQAFASK